MAKFTVYYRMVINGYLEVEAADEDEAKSKVGEMDDEALAAGSTDTEREFVSVDETEEEDDDGEEE